MKRIPYDPSELIPIRVEQPIMPGFPSKPVYSTPITVKKNFIMSLTGENPLWMPNAFSDSTMICPETPDNISRAFIFENEPMDMEHVGGKDMFGVTWEYIPSVGGSMVRAGNPKIPDINHWEDYISFPDLDKIIDWEAISQRNKTYCKPDKPLVVCILTGLFERLISFMDMEGAMIALVDDEQKPGVHRLFSRLCDFYDEYFRLYKKYFNCDIFMFHDDWGSQRSPFFSLDTVREMLLPYLKRVADSVHRLGCLLEFHSCGKNELLVPAMVEAGADTWAPQFHNDFDLIYQNWGDELVVVIPLKDYVNENMSDEEMYVAIERFIEKYPKAMATTWMAPDRAAEMLYVASRKAFNK